MRSAGSDRRVESVCLDDITDEAIAGPWHPTEFNRGVAVNPIPDEILRPALVTLLQSGTGLACDFGQLVRVSQLDTTRYWVTSDSPDGDRLWAEEYDTLDEAVDVFLALRQTLRPVHDQEPCSEDTEIELKLAVRENT
jgi:hypothetical protein